MIEQESWFFGINLTAICIYSNCPIHIIVFIIIVELKKILYSVSITYCFYWILN